MFVIKLGETGLHFSTAGSRSSHNHNLLRGGNVWVRTIALGTHDEINIRRIATRRPVRENRYTPPLETIHKLLCGRLIVIARNYNCTYIKIPVSEIVYVGYAKICIASNEKQKKRAKFLSSIMKSYAISIYFKINTVTLPTMLFELRDRKTLIEAVVVQGGLSLLLFLPRPLVFHL